MKPSTDSATVSMGVAESPPNHRFRITDSADSVNRITWHTPMSAVIRMVIRLSG